VGVQCRLRCSLLGRWTINTVQEPFSRLLPQHVLVRPPPLAGCISVKPGRSRKLHSPAAHDSTRTYSRSTGKTEKFVMGPIALLATVLLFAFPPVSGPDKVRPSHRRCSKSPEDRSQPDQYPLPFDVVLGTCDIFGSSPPPVPGAALLIEKRLSIRLVSSGKICQQA
jgi:hypothetical protein